MIKSKKFTGVKLMTYFLLIMGAILMILPLLWMISSSFKPAVKIYEVPVRWIPETFDFSNYTRLFTDYQFHRYLLNSLLLAAINITGNVISCSLVAYGFSFMRFRYKKRLFALLLATMMLPGEVIFFPQFLLFNYIGWFGSLKPLWAPSFFGNAFFIFLLRQYFLTIPGALLEAARIDGCSEFRIYRKIVMPLSKPAVMVVVLYTFMQVWNDFFGPLIYSTREENRTAAVALNYMRNTYEGTSSIPITMAASVILILPSILIFYLGQRFFIQGIVFKGVDK